MKDPFDVAEDVISLINIPEVTSQLGGKVYHIDMPPGLNTSNIVVGVLFAKNKQIQVGIVNVRIHVPNIQIDNKPMPDQLEFRKIINLITPYLDNQYRESFWTEIERFGGPLSKDSDDSYYALIRVKYYSIQNNFKNI